MNKPRLILLMLIFIANLGLGYRAGTVVASFYQPGPERGVAGALKQQPLRTPAPIPSLGNGQRTILIVITDDLESPQPQLEGVWLAAYVPGHPKITFLPVYPSSRDKESRAESLVKSFSILRTRQSSRLAEAFLDALQMRDLWWSAYIVLDDQAWVEIMQNFPGSRLPTGWGKSTSPAAGNRLQSALFEQAYFYQELCWNGASLADPTGQEYVRIVEVFNGTLDHMCTNLHPDQILFELKNLALAEEPIYCDFPTLSLQTRAFIADTNPQQIPSAQEAK